MGIVKCRERAKSSVWWPLLSKQIEDIIANCNMCVLHQNENREPLMKEDPPDKPWEKLDATYFVGTIEQP